MQIQIDNMIDDNSARRMIKVNQWVDALTQVKSNPAGLHIKIESAAPEAQIEATPRDATVLPRAS